MSGLKWAAALWHEHLAHDSGFTPCNLQKGKFKDFAAGISCRNHKLEAYATVNLEF